MTSTQVRKADHLRICLEENVETNRLTTGFERYRFSHCCLPELNYSEIDLRTSFLNHTLGAPLLISSMTGGTPQAKTINYRLAKAAERYQLAMGVGSQRIIVENPAVADTFTVRRVAPNILLFANLGAVQLNYQYGVSECLQLIDVLEADALILHLNPLQECIQTKGDTNFSGLLDKINNLCSKLPVPVVVKEIGNGISGQMAAKLLEVGVSAIDVAGAGGTSWAKVEGGRATNRLQRSLGKTFADWGIPTADCLTSIRQRFQNVPLIASGGIRNGIDMAKAIALGADLVGLALPFLQAADKSEEAVEELIELLQAEISTVLFCTGNQNLEALKQSDSLEAVV